MKLSEEQLAIISKAAAQAALDHLKRERDSAEKKKKDHRLHNIKLLLKNYRSLLLHCEEIVPELDSFYSTSIQELDVEEITFEAIESIKKSKEKSLVMVLFIQNKIEAYKKSCDEDEMKYFRTLNKMYLMESKWNVNQIADSEGVDRATVYRYIERAIKDLAVIIFGIDVLDLRF